MGATVAIAIVSFGLWSVTESRRAAEVAARERARQEAEARFMLAPSVPTSPKARDLDALRRLGKTVHLIAEDKALSAADWSVDVYLDEDVVEAVGNARSGGSYTKADREAFRLAAWYAKHAADLAVQQAKDGTWRRSPSVETRFESAVAAFDQSLARATRAAEERG